MKPNAFILIICSLIGITLGLGGFTFYYAKGASYLQNDPKACVNCHIMREQYDGWQKSPHHAVATCNDCHTPHAFIPKYLVKMENGFWHSKGFTLQDFHEPIRLRPQSAEVLHDNCIRCHGTFVSEISTRAHNVGDKVDCVRCHADVGHGPTE